LLTGPPIITIHPTSQLVSVNMSVTLNCEGTGRGSITYQWETSNIEGQWINISNSNSENLVVKNLEQSQQYSCIVSNDAGRTQSNIVTVTVLSKYVKIDCFLYSICNLTEITTHPQDKIVATNSTVILTCTSSVSSNVIFTWTHNGTSINELSSKIGDTSILTITSVRNNDAGSYVCIVSSGSLSVMSNTATLTVYGMSNMNASDLPCIFA